MPPSTYAHSLFTTPLAWNELLFATLIALALTLAGAFGAVYFLGYLTRPRKPLRPNILVPLLSLFGMLMLAAALNNSSNDPREQIIILERFAQKLERAQRIDPDTERFLKYLVASAQAAQDPNIAFHRRRLSAIYRIEAALVERENIVGTIGDVQRKSLPE